MRQALPNDLTCNPWRATPPLEGVEWPRSLQQRSTAGSFVKLIDLTPAARTALTPVLH